MGGTFNSQIGEQAPVVAKIKVQKAKHQEILKQVLGKS